MQSSQWTEVASVVVYSLLGMDENLDVPIRPERYTQYYPKTARYYEKRNKTLATKNVSADRGATVNEDKIRENVTTEEKTDHQPAKTSQN